MEPEHYTMDELARESDVKVRNIRYYIAEGLLPPPSERGRYSRSHLIRLRFIRRLSRQFVRLERIREALQRTDEEIEALLQASPTDEDALAAESLSLHEETPGEKARRYIAQALGKAPPEPAQAETSAEFELFAGAAPSAAREASVDAFAAPLARKMRRAAAPPSPSPGENYQRIVLQEGLELHVRTPISPEMQTLIAQLIALAQNPRTS